MLMHCATNQGGLAAATSAPAFYWITRTLAAGGGAGVDVFFVISGFVITSVGMRAHSARRRLAAGLEFVLRRIFRMFPLYWAALASMVALAAAFGDTRAELAVAWQLPVLALATDQIPFLAPAWTLAFEVWFYAGTGLIICLLPGRYFLVGLGAWATAQSLFLIAPWLVENVPDFYALRQPQLLNFFLGCAIAAVLSRRPAKHGKLPRIALVAGPILFALGYVRCFALLPTGSLDHWQRLAFYGIPAALVLYALLLLEQTRSIHVPGWLYRLGDWSYSIYLWHYPVMAASFVFLSWHPAFRIGPPLVVAAVNALLTLVMAPLSFWMIERPFNRLGSFCSRWAAAGRQHGVETGVGEPVR